MQLIIEFDRMFNCNHEVSSSNLLPILLWSTVDFLNSCWLPALLKLYKYIFKIRYIDLDIVYSLG